MKGFGKRCRTLAGCILLLCLLTVFASATPVEHCVGSCAHQAAIGTTHYDTLSEAITAAKSGSSVTLLADVTTTAPLTIDKPLALDLGGCTITASLSAPQQAVLHFTKGGVVRGGKIIASTGSALLVSDCTVAIEEDAILEAAGTAPVLCVTASQEQNAQINLSGTITGKPCAVSAASESGSCTLYILKDAKLTSEEDTAIIFDCAGKLEMADGTVQAKKDAISVTLEKTRKTELAITGGEVRSDEGQVIVIAAEEDAEIPTDFITGGTFHKLPNTYVPSYCKIQQNADGTYSVISAYTLTFLPGTATGIMEPVKVRCGNTFTLPLCSFTAPANMDFAGWEIGGSLFAPGDTYTPGSSVNVAALWKAHEHTGGYATCLSKAVCTSCGKAYGKLGEHKLSYSVGYGATCTTTGMNAHSKCSLCGNLFVDGVVISASSLTVPALGHDWVATEGKPATCEEDGIHDYRACSVCGTLQIEGKTVAEEALSIPATGHKMEAVAATQATCTEAGIQAHEHCTVCDWLFLNGKAVTINELTTATATHVLSDWISDEYSHWKACVDCGEVFRQSSHNDANGACSDCGYELPLADTAGTSEKGGFSFLFLMPIIAAVAIAVPLAIKKRKE